MPIITSTQITEQTPIRPGFVFARFQYTLDNGEFISDGPRFLPTGTDLTAYASAQGQALLDAAAGGEIDTWLLS